MAPKRKLEVSSERQNWNVTYNALVKMSRREHESAAEERKLLEDRFRILYERWLSEGRLFQERIDELKARLLLRDRESSLEAAKSEMAIGIKQRQNSLGQLELDHAKTDLLEFRALLKLLQDESLDPKDPIALKSELRRLRRENEKLAAVKNSEVSALLAEKAFVWNQYKILESDCAYKLKSKDAEVQQAKEKVQAVIARMEQSQSSDGEKDEKIARLMSELTKMREESNKLKEENYQLKAGLNSLRKCRSDSATPVLRHCGNRVGHSNLRGKQSDKNAGSTCLRKDSFGIQALESSDKVKKKPLKREREDLGLMTLPPKLFSSAFKPPKLKNTASAIRI